MRGFRVRPYPGGGGVVSEALPGLFLRSDGENEANGRRKANERVGD